MEKGTAHPSVLVRAPRRPRLYLEWFYCVAQPAGRLEERQLFTILSAKKAEAELGRKCLFCSLSSRRLGLQRLLLHWQLAVFYPGDLGVELRDFELYLQSFIKGSRRTPASLAAGTAIRCWRTYGEINTITGQRRWIQPVNPEILVGLMRAQFTRWRTTQLFGQSYNAVDSLVHQSMPIDQALNHRGRP